MFVKRNRSILVVSLLVLAVILAACGGGPNAPAESNQGTLGEIKQRGKMLLATEADFEPFEFTENGKIVGYDIDILEEVAKDMGVTYELMDVPFSGLLPGLASKKYDYIPSGFTVTKERLEKYDFSIPVADATYAWLVKNDSNLTSAIEDWAGKVVGTQLNSAGEPAIEQVSQALKGRGLQDFVEVKKYQTPSECYLEVANGRISGCMYVVTSIAVVAKKQAGVYDVVNCEVCPRLYLAFPVRKGDTALRDQLDKTLLRLHEEGELQEFQHKWFGFTMDLPKEHVEPSS